MNSRSATERVTLADLATVATGIVALLVFAEAIATAVALHTNLPYYDEWATVADFGRLRTGDYGLADWFAQHNEHRPAFPRLVLFADFQFFGGQGYLYPAVNITLQFAESVVLSAAAFGLYMQQRIGMRTFVVCCAAALALQFTTAQIETFIIPFQVLWTIGYTAGTGALAALAAAHSAKRPRVRTGLVGVAVALAIVSQYSVANGIWVWALLAIMAWWLRAPRAWLITIVTAGIICSAAYFAGYSQPAESQDPVASLARPDRVVDFALVVIGGPVLPMLGQQAARLLGAVGLVGIGLVLAQAMRRRDRAEGATTLLVAQVLFSSLTIGLIAVGRSPLGIGAAEAPRYVMPAATLWTCIVILASASTGGFRVVRGARLAGIVAGAFLVTTALGSAWWAVQPWADTFDNLEATSDAIRVGVYDDSALIRLYPAPGDIKAFVPILKRYDLSVFRGDDLSELLDTPLANRYVISSNDCRGFFDTTLDARSPAGAGVSGWAWDLSRDARPSTVLIAGPDGIIRGIATASTSRVDVALAVPEVTAVDSGWFGYSRPTGGPGRAYAVMGAGVVCALEGEHEVVATPS